MKKFLFLFISIFSFSILNAQDFISTNKFTGAGSNAVLNNKLYAAINNSTTGAELYVIDGIAAEPVLVKDINPGSSGSNLSDLITFDNKIYFSADDGTNGQELWVSDGTEAGTMLLKDIFIGNAFSGSFPQYFTILNNKLYFTAATSIGYELWVTDGTTAGTVLVKDVNSGSGFSNARPRFTTVLNNKLYFYAQGGSAGTGIWESDGTNAGTVLAIPDATVYANNNTELGRFIVYNNKIYFNGFIAGGSSYQLCSSDGTIAGTQLVKTINPTGDADVRSPFVFNNTLFFSATDGVNGSELYKTDGTDAGTQLVKEIFVGGTAFNNSSFPREPVFLNNRVYFAAQDATNGTKIWETKGTEATTKIVDGAFSASSPSFLTVYDNKLYFNTVNGTNDGLYVYTPPIALTNSTPTANSSNIALDSNITLTFTGVASAAIVNTTNIKISGAQTGNIAGVFTGADTNTITFNPTNNFKPGELITVTLTAGIAEPTTFSFTAKVPFKVTPFQPTDTPLEIATLTDDVGDFVRILTGDLNNDGFLDIIATDNVKINWLLSSGGANPTYTKYESAATTATSEIRSIKLADINNDGFLDIVTANTNSTIWLENNGNVTTGFTIHTIANNSAVNTVHFVEVTDLDKDGTMDILYIDINGVLTWYKNNGASTPVFTPQVIFDDANRVRLENDLIARDMDNDGDVDILYITFNPNEIVLLENDGNTSPSFTKKVLKNSANGFSYLLVEDINGDGFLDVATTEFISSISEFVWFENNGASNPLTFTERNDANLTQSRFSLYASADLDGDGDTDFITTDSNTPNNLIYLENNSTTNPVSFTKVALENVSSAEANATIGDTDNDGSLNIITLDFLEKVSILKGKPAITLTSTSPIANSNNVLQNSVIVLNFSGTTYAPNVNTTTIKVTGLQTGNIAGVLSGAGTNQITFTPTNNYKPGELITVTITDKVVSNPTTFSFTAKVPFKVTPFQPTDTPLEIATLTDDVNDFRKILTGDLNNDGFLDIIATDDVKINWLLSSGGANPTYTKYESAATTATSEIYSIKLADINNDGFLDIVTANVNQTVWFQNNGNATTGFTEILIANTGSNNILEVTDLNQDGAMDVLQIDGFGVLTWYKNNGATTPVFTSHFIFDDPNRLLGDYNDLVAKDMDNDGDVDLVYNTFLSSNREVVLLENNGESTPTFTRSVIGGNSSSNPIGNLLVTDINGDGFLDVAFTERTLSASAFFFVWLENNSAGNPLTFTERNDANLTQQFNNLYASADIDGDGDIDFISIDSNTPNNLMYLENNSTTNPVSFTKVALQNVVGIAQNATFGDTDNDGDLDIITLGGDKKVSILKGKPAITVTSTSPTANSNNVLQNSTIVLNFSGTTYAPNVNATTIKVTGLQTGNIAGVLSGAGTNQITFTPTNNYKPGELITVTITDKVISNPTTFSFTAKVPFKVTPFQPTDTPLEIATLTDDVDSGLVRILTGDLNNDGFLDIIATDNVKINWLLSSGGANPTYTKYESAATTATSEIYSIKLADINNDGFLDIVTANINQTVWFQNNGNATTGFTQILIANNSGTGLNFVEITDLDQDGAMDILQIDIFGVLTWYKNNGATTPVFTPQIIFDDPNRLSVDLNDLVAKDMDNDGDVDLVYNTFLSANREIILLENNGQSNPTFTRSVIGGNSSNNLLGNLLVTDINGDGFLDVAFTERTSSGSTYFFVWLENNGASNPLTFTERNDANLTQSGHTLYAVADIDGDGDIDFISIDSNTPNNLIYLENNSTTNPVSFTKVALQNVVGIAQNATFGDTDNDGSLDIITLDANQKVRIFKGRKAINTFLGTTNNLWSTLNNWSFGTLPLTTEEVKINTATSANIDIPTVVHKITIEGTLKINAGKSLTVSGDIVQNGTFSIQSDATTSGSLISNGTYSGSGKIDYERYVSDAWHLISVPVDFVLADPFANAPANNLDFKMESGTGPDYKKYALALYDNSLGDGLRYNYYTDFNGPNPISFVGPFQRARGYSARRKTAGTYTFTGGFFSDTAIFSLDDNSGSGGNKWNLLGNPYTSFIAINTDAHPGDNFLTVNGVNLDPARVAVYVWNAATSSYDVFNNATGSAKYIAPGQGFFVQAKDGASSLATFKTNMQSHQTGDFFSKSASTTPEIKVSVSNADVTKTTQIKYLENTTTGLDVGYDAGTFSESDTSFSIFTQLVSESTGINFAVQCLPSKDLETMIIPLGIAAKANTTITISAESTNLPTGINTYLEDREKGVFINLNDENYTLTTTTVLNGVGRFFLHTRASVLSTNSEVFSENINIYKTTNNTVRIVGLTNGTAKITLFDVLGKQVLSTNFESKGTNDIQLPNLKTGVYLVSLKTDKRTITKKIIIE